ncbi:hypothetical protein PQX77_019292 [Marasmius sp. AFHP31]|nr:hypothetical protein PQX77_019292 [Marasmius sp. AFHP31]
MAGYTYSQQIAEEASKGKPKQTFEETVPPEYWGSKRVFLEEESEQLPSHKPWNHAIKLVPGAPQTMKTKIEGKHGTMPKKKQKDSLNTHERFSMLDVNMLPEMKFFAVFQS